MKLKMKVEGLRELSALFAQSAQDARIAGRIASNKALEPALRDTIAAAPFRTGLLRSQLTKGVLNGRQAQRDRVTVGASLFVKPSKRSYTYVDNASNRRSGRAGKKYRKEGPGFYGRFQEFGYFNRRTGKHVPGKFYMTRAFEANRQTMLQLLVANFRPYFEKAVARRAARQIARLKGARR